MSRLATKTSERESWSIDEVEHLYLEGVSWELYEHLLKVVGNRPLRLTYDNGELEIMSPLPEHEIGKSALGRFVSTITEELDIPCQILGSTTFRRKMKKKGLEPDDCFYIKSQPLIKGKKRINLPKDPPPDLAIEVDVTSRSIPRLPIYAGLGVPEIWRLSSKTVECMWLEREKYRESEFSRAFPKLRVADLMPFVRIAEEESDHTAAVKSFRAWLKKQAWVR